MLAWGYFQLLMVIRPGLLYTVHTATTKPSQKQGLGVSPLCEWVVDSVARRHGHFDGPALFEYRAHGGEPEPRHGGEGVADRGEIDGDGEGSHHHGLVDLHHPLPHRDLHEPVDGVRVGEPKQARQGYSAQSVHGVPWKEKAFVDSCCSLF